MSLEDTERQPLLEDSGGQQNSIEENCNYSIIQYYLLKEHIASNFRVELIFDSLRYLCIILIKKMSNFNKI